MDKLVVNLSDTYLTKEQTSVLAKGLNFCPTPGSLNPGELRSDLDCFHRKLRLTSYFNDEEEELDLPPQKEITSVLINFPIQNSNRHPSLT